MWQRRASSPLSWSMNSVPPSRPGGASRFCRVPASASPARWKAAGLLGCETLEVPEAVFALPAPAPASAGDCALSHARDALPAGLPSRSRWGAPTATHTVSCTYPAMTSGLASGQVRHTGLPVRPAFSRPRDGGRRPRPPASRPSHVAPEAGGYYSIL